MNKKELVQRIRGKKSFLCIGLDTDITKLPAHFRNVEDPVFEFNKAIIEATSEFCVAYKPNIAFYESMGPAGWESLRKTLECIPDDVFTIADAKRGDIGNTSSMYARTFFEQYNFDAVTVAPYMGTDSVIPFLEYKNKWVILLALTSNTGALDFQMEQVSESERLFEKVLKVSKQWGTTDNMMYVVGATRDILFTDVRRVVPDHFLLVPGIGSQGGNLAEVCRNGMNDECGLLVNASRSILYASSGTDFAAAAAAEAGKIQLEMEQLLRARGILATE